MGARWKGQKTMKHCIGAMDGTHIPIWCIDGQQEVFRCRKGFYSINFQLISDAVGYILWQNGGRPGRTWDGHGIENTVLETELMKALPSNYYIIADSGYQGDQHVLVPFKRRPLQDLTEQQHRFNFIHSILRGVVEKTIGQLKARFRWMLKGTPFQKIEKYADCFAASCILHNMMLDERLKKGNRHDDPDLFEVTEDDDQERRAEYDLVTIYKNNSKTMPDPLAVQKLKTFYAAEVELLKRAKLREETDRAQALQKRQTLSRRRARSQDPPHAEEEEEEAHDADESLLDDYAEDDKEVDARIKENGHPEAAKDRFEDRQAGVELRTRLFLELELQSYVPSNSDKKHREMRAKRLAMRGGQGSQLNT